MKALAICVLCLLIGSISGCFYDKEELLYPQGSCNGANAKFGANVHPLIQTRCAIEFCHNAGSVNIGGPFTNYDQIKNKAALIRNAVVTGLMPQGSSLSATEITTISCWVDSGAPNN